ncbi:MAG: NAD(P)H-hydrate dehydratase [Promethearchaeota archaeon]
MKISDAISSEEMVAIEGNAEHLGISRLLLMENAGRAVADEILKRIKPESCVVIFSGLGGNGGDGFVTARHLASHCKIHLVVLGNPSLIKHAEALINWEIVNKMHHSLRIHVVRSASELPDIKSSVVVDAILGTGMRGTPREPMLQALQLMNRMSGTKIAVDLPTGLHPDTGVLTTESAFQPDITITFHRPKQGLVRGKEHIGKLVVADIGIPPEAELYIGPGDILRVYKPRHPHTKKGDFGRLLIIGGSDRYVGAPILASLGALRSGVDIIYLAAPPNVISAATSQSPDIIPIPFKTKILKEATLSKIHGSIKQVDALLIGPGLGEHSETLAAARQVFSLAAQHDKPTIVDADALKVISEVEKLSSTTIITPHAGELSYITGRTVSQSLDKRAQEVRTLARKLGCVVLLKGPVDIIADPEKTRYNWTGTPALSIGGTGDVLAGVISGIRAQGVQSFLAACVGAFINGAAGQLAFQDKGVGLVASDLTEHIHRVIIDPGAIRALYHSQISIEE